MQKLIAANRRKLDWDLRDSPRRQYFSATVLSQYRVTVPLIQKYAAGALIDVGCGLMPYRSLVGGQLSRYDSLDPRPQTADVTYRQDVQAMTLIPDETYDSAICLEVLEHVPNPFRAAAELHRILKPGGVLIVSAPHLSRLHEEPHDFFRFTGYGLTALFEGAGFEVLHLARRGGLLSFLSHQVSTVVVGLTWSIPGLGKLVFFLNEWLCVRPAYFLDAYLDRAGPRASFRRPEESAGAGKFSLGYTIVVRKGV
jgi:SAM-dependent methyltransferase